MDWIRLLWANFCELGAVTRALLVVAGVVLVLVALQAGCNTVSNLRDSVHAYFFDRIEAKHDTNVNREKTGIEANDEVVKQKDEEIKALQAEKAALTKALADQGVNTEKATEVMNDERRKLDEVREGGYEPSPDADAVYRRLREAYPPGKQKPAARGR
jgi:hypothetical protein